MTATKVAQAKTANAELPPLPFYKSKVFVGAVIALVATALQQFGLVASITPVGQEQVADLIVAAFQGGGALMAAVARLIQKTAPPISAA